MRRQIIAFISALVTWVAVVSVLNRLLRSGLSGYAAAEPVMAFTSTMLWLRLAMGAAASVSAGYVLGRVAPPAHRAALILGGLLVAAFVPVHYQLWSRFPAWYHAAFLLSIVPLVSLGARLGRSSASPAA